MPAPSPLMTALKMKKWTALLGLIAATEEKSSMISIHKQSRLTEKVAQLPRSVRTRKIMCKNIKTSGVKNVKCHMKCCTDDLCNSSAGVQVSILILFTCAVFVLGYL